MFRQDGRFLLGARSGAATLWNVETGRLIRTFEGHQSSIHSVAFSLDERRVLTGAGNPDPYRRPGEWDFTARLWDVPTGKQIGVMEGFKGHVYLAQFSPDGKQIMTLSIRDATEGTPVLELWNAQTLERQFELLGMPVIAPQRSVARPRRRSVVQFSPRGESIIGVSTFAMTMWDSATGDVIWRIGRDSEHSEGKTEEDQQPRFIGRFFGVEFSPDGRLVLAACRHKSSDGTRTAGAAAFDSATGRLVQTYQAEDADPIDAVFCDAGAHVMSATSDGTTRLWETESGREIRRFDHPGALVEMAVSSTGRRMVSKWNTRAEGGELRAWFATVWDVDSGLEIKRFELEEGGNRGLTLSPDGRRILANLDENKVYLLDAESGEVIHHYE
jgi:WD40 repeat protein